MTPFPPALATLSWGLGEFQSTQFCLGLNLSDWCLMRRGIIHLVQAGLGIKHLHPGSQKIVVLSCFTTEYKWIQEKHSYMGPEGACNQVSWSLDEIAAFALAQYVQLATVWWKLFWNQNGITNQRKFTSPLYLTSIKHGISYVTFSQGWTAFDRQHCRINICSYFGWLCLVFDSSSNIFSSSWALFSAYIYIY